MAVCNIFNDLTKETGTFFTFSQYLEDLTKEQVESQYYRIVPSKYIALDIQSEKLFSNSSFPRKLQEHFENGCAIFKNVLKNNWTPQDSANLFWQTMFTHIITENDIKYIGDIDIQSYNNVDGIGYSEIYCHIPNEAKPAKYSFNIEKSIISQTIQKYAKDFLEGWDKVYELSEDINYSLQYKYTLNDTKTELNDESFNINSMIVLYDIVYANGEKITNIPMGIYVTGRFDDQHKLQNSITKFVNSADIYGAGTSYGLRICSRYSVSPNNDKYTIQDITVEHNNYGDLSRVLSQISITQNKIDDLMKSIISYSQCDKERLAIFKNAQINVPYIKTVNGVKYWFVNGKQLEPIYPTQNENN